MEKRWNTDKVRKYIGSFESSWFAYATSEHLRTNAASGGVITALLLNLINKGDVDGALVCGSIIENGRAQPLFFIAQDKEALLSAQGSKYNAVDFNRDALPLIREFKGRLAVVALPCDTTNLHRVCENDPCLNDKVAVVITLFCGHNSRHELTDMVVDQLAPAGASLTGFRYRQGHWRGSLTAEFDSGERIEKPFSTFSDYQNLFFYCQQKCHHCIDHTGFNGDISIGDIWSRRMKSNPIKHNAIIVRNSTGSKIFAEAINAVVLTAFPETIAAVCEGQARSLPFHYNISARAKAGSFLRIKIKDSVHERVRWNHFLVALIALFNEKLSRSPGGQRIIRFMPRFILKMVLYVMKGLESI